MKKFLFILIGIGLILCSCNFSTRNSKVKPESNSKHSNFDGVYNYGDSTGDGPNGQVIIYTESNESVLFYISISRGAPSYNSGSLYDRITIKNRIGTFYKKYEFEEHGCKWTFVFSYDTLTIKTIDLNYGCGFGGNVIADGIYKKVKNLQQDFFIDSFGEKYYFSKTKPEDYVKILK